MVRNILAKALVALLCLSSRTSANLAQTATTLDDIQNQALTNAYRVLDGTLSDGLSRSPNTHCNTSTVAIRKELSSLLALAPSPHSTNPLPAATLRHPSEKPTQLRYPAS